MQRGREAKDRLKPDPQPNQQDGLVLSPQGRSFLTGCQVATTTSGDKGGGNSGDGGGENNNNSNGGRGRGDDNGGGGRDEYSSRGQGCYLLQAFLEVFSF